jgi:hypothetical protein
MTGNFEVSYGRLPFLVIIPIWLVVLVLAAGLAFIPDTRRVAAYVAVCSTSGLIVSITFSTLALVLYQSCPGGPQALRRAAWPSSQATLEG